jgi:hypothetical protein
MEQEEKKTSQSFINGRGFTGKMKVPGLKIQSEDSDFVGLKINNQRESGENSDAHFVNSVVEDTVLNLKGSTTTAFNESEINRSELSITDSLIETQKANIKKSKIIVDSDSSLDIQDGGRSGAVIEKSMLVASTRSCILIDSSGKSSGKEGNCIFIDTTGSMVVKKTVIKEDEIPEDEIPSRSSVLITSKSKDGNRVTKTLFESEKTSKSESSTIKKSSVVLRNDSSLIINSSSIKGVLIDINSSELEINNVENLKKLFLVNLYLAWNLAEVNIL